jgi:hypothetical protein
MEQSATDMIAPGTLPHLCARLVVLALPPWILNHRRCDAHSAFDLDIHMLLPLDQNGEDLKVTNHPESTTHAYIFPALLGLDDLPVFDCYFLDSQSDPLGL